MSEDLEFVYVGDPLCSWCWGFAPVLERLTQRYAVPVRTVVGGLRPGTSAEPLDDRMRAFLLHHWEAVEAASGQPFNRGVLDREDFVYDTEPACMAVVAMRELAGEETLRWFARIQRAFYVEGVDVTDLDAFPPLLDGFSVDAERLAETLRDPATRQRTWQDFGDARAMGVTGFPGLLLRDGGDLLIVTRGFVPWAQLEPALTAWLEDHYGEAAEGLVCPLGEPC